MTREAFENAITVDMAIGGSTNAVVHLLAIAGRLGIDLQLDEFDAISRRTPYIVNVKPSGRISDGGFLLCRGLAGGHARDSALPAWRCDHGDGKNDP